MYNAATVAGIALCRSWARKPEIRPVSVSPAPAVPSPALPVGFMNTRPSGVATSERAPYRQGRKSATSGGLKCLGANGRNGALEQREAAKQQASVKEVAGKRVLEERDGGDIA